MLNDFAIFILSSKRPNNIVTLKSLDDAGYTGKIYIIVDNEDNTAERYKELYGNNVIVFDKEAISKEFDSGDNFNDRGAVIYARNASFQIAKDLGLKYFMELDDDYTGFYYRYDKELAYRPKQILNLDGVLDAMLTCFKEIPALTLAMAQGGDFIGGKDSGFSKKLEPKRKAMNTFICAVDRPFYFIGRINEDVNTYCNLGSRGYLFFTIGNVSINQVATQKGSGGMTDQYLDKGTFFKSFYSVMYNPSSVIISTMGRKFKRLHHGIKWNNTVPRILSESFKKTAGEQQI